jgi:uncharacterized protein YxeA
MKVVGVIGLVLCILLTITALLSFAAIAFSNANEYQVRRDSDYQRIEDEEQVEFIKEYYKKQEEKRGHKSEAHNKGNGASDL